MKNMLTRILLFCFLLAFQQLQAQFTIPLCTKDLSVALNTGIWGPQASGMSWSGPQGTSLSCNPCANAIFSVNQAGFYAVYGTGLQIIQCVPFSSAWRKAAEMIRNTGDCAPFDGYPNYV